MSCDFNININEPEPEITGGIHFSLDDVFQFAYDLATDSKSETAPIVQMAKVLANDFNINTLLNVYYESPYTTQSNVHNLSQIIPDGESNSWGEFFRFSPHALNKDTPPHVQEIAEQWASLEKIYEQIIRIFGRESIGSQVRLHHYSECYEISALLHQYGVGAMFTTDKPVGSHRLHRKFGQILADRGYLKVNGIDAMRTDFRTEDLFKNSVPEREIFCRIDRIMEKRNFIVIYGHEYEYLVNKDLYGFTLKLIDTIKRRIEVI